MSKLLMVAWRAVLGATVGAILTVLGSLTQTSALTSGEDPALFAAAGYGMLFGALLGGLFGWLQARR